MKSRAQLSWNSTFRWAPTSRTGGGSFTGQDNFLERDLIPFKNDFFLRTCFIFTCIYFFSSLSIPPFPFFIFVIVFFFLFIFIFDLFS